MQERRTFSLPGFPMFVLILALAAFGVWALSNENFAFAVPSFVLAVFLLVGFFIVQPNMATVVTLFGRYVGTERRAGWYWTNPLTTRKSISLRIRNFTTERLKVNDNGGSPIEIAAVVVWRVVDTARASFDVDNYENFVAIQSETALRNLASRYPYDAHKDGEVSLRGSADEIAETLQSELSSRLTHAGVEVVEARLSHLAYSPEIASAMLQRQQAAAIVAARATIVAGAVGMVEEALRMISDQNLVQLDEERKAQMVSNLLVVLTSERGTQPVVNAGSLY